MTHETFLRDTETSCHVCRYAVNHSNVYLIIAFMAQSDTLNLKFPDVVQSHTLGEVGILGSFVKGLFWDSPSSFY